MEEKTKAIVKNTEKNYQQISIDQFDNFIKKFPTYGTLIKCGEYSLDLFNNKNEEFYNYVIEEKDKQTITQWGLALISFRSVLRSNDGRGYALSEQDFFQLNSQANSIKEPFSEDKNLTSFLQRISQEQFPAQNSKRSNCLARYYDIFKSSNLSQDFQDVYDISIEDYMLTGMAIFGLIIKNNNPIIDFDNVNIETNNKRINDVFIREKKEKFRNIAFADYNEFRSLIIGSCSIPGYEKYEFNPLYSKPIIDGDNRYSYLKGKNVVPNVEALISKITKGIYWDLRDYYRKKDSQDFLNSFGDLFKDYVGRILKNYFGENNVVDLDIYKEKNSIKGKIADWLICLDEIELLIECKSSLLSQKVKQTFIPEVFQKWCIDSKFSKAVDQLLETDKVLSKTEKKRYNVIVILEDLYLAEMPEVKKKIDPRVDDFFITTIADLENMENWIKKYGIEKIIEEKLASDKRNNPAEGREFMQVCFNLDNEIKMHNSFLNDIYNTALKF